MPLKSVLEVDVNDESFRRFKEKFDQYQTALSKMPEAWKGAAKEQDIMSRQFQQVSAALMAHSEIVDKTTEQHHKTTAEVDKQARSWHNIALDSRRLEANVISSTRSIMKWGGLLAGVVGIGSLFGLDKLTSSVAAARQSASGLNVKVGEQSAFDIAFSRFVGSPDAMLSRVAAGLSDPTDPAYRAITQVLGDVRGLNAAEVSARLLEAIPRKFPQGANDWTLGTMAHAFGYPAVGVGVEDIKRVLNASPEELAKQRQMYTTDKAKLDIPPDEQRAIQDFDSALSESSKMIKNTFILGLAPLINGPDGGPLGHLSKATQNLIQVFTGAVQDHKWIDKLAHGLDDVTARIASPAFDAGLTRLVDSVDKLANGFGRLLALLPDNSSTGLGEFLDAADKGPGGVLKWMFTPDNPVPGSFADHWKKAVNGLPGVVAGADQAVRSWDHAQAERERSWFNGRARNNLERHNPGGMRAPGQSTGFRSFPSDEAGVQAIARQLMIYQNRDHLDTISGIVSKYAPSMENDVKAYVGDISKLTGYGPSQHLNLSDPEVLSKLVSAITKHEHIKYFPPNQTRVIIEKATGADVNVSVAALAAG
jgi:hypothetical protein